MEPFIDPGDCPCSWGQQIYDGRFRYSKVKLLQCDSNNLCTYRVCFQHRYSQYHPKNWWMFFNYYYFYGWWYWYYWYNSYWSFVTNYMSECCWTISLQSIISSSYLGYYSGYNYASRNYISPYPYSWNARTWVHYGRLLISELKI